MIKKILVGLVALLVVVFGVLFFITNKNESLSSNQLAIEHISLSNDRLMINGTILSSGTSYRHYSYDRMDNKIQITIFGGLVTKKHSNGDFDITIKDDEFQGVDTFYLKHEDDELIRIYPE